LGFGLDRAPSCQFPGAEIGTVRGELNNNWQQAIKEGAPAA